MCRPTRAQQVLKYFVENKAWMEDRIASGIEANRKGWLKLSFVDAEGNPVENVQLSLEQKTHDFKFGCNLFMLDELETQEKNQRFREMYPQLFNLATLPFYWANLEPEPGKLRFGKDSVKNYRRPAPDLCLEYCREKGIEPKLHCLVYDQWSPKWLPEDAREIKGLLDQRIAQIADRYRDQIPSMEVINETQCSYITGKDDRKSTPFFLEPDIIEWSFDHARKYLPANKLIINEATGHVWGNRYKYTRSAYYLQIQRALEKGATVFCLHAVPPVPHPRSRTGAGQIPAGSQAALRGDGYLCPAEPAHAGHRGHRLRLLLGGSGRICAGRNAAQSLPHMVQPPQYGGHRLLEHDRRLRRVRRPRRYDKR